MTLSRGNTEEWKYEVRSTKYAKPGNDACVVPGVGAGCRYAVGMKQPGGGSTRQKEVRKAGE